MATLLRAVSAGTSPARKTLGNPSAKSSTAATAEAGLPLRRQYPHFTLGAAAAQLKRGASFHFESFADPTALSTHAARLQDASSMPSSSHSTLTSSARISPWVEVLSLPTHAKHSNSNSSSSSSADNVTVLPEIPLRSHGFGLVNPKTQLVTITAAPLSSPAAAITTEGKTTRSSLLPSAEQITAAVEATITRRLLEAYRWKKVLLKVPSAETTYYRLAHGLGDGIPGGLTLDVVGNTAVLNNRFNCPVSQQHVVPILKEIVEKKMYLDWYQEEAPGPPGSVLTKVQPLGFRTQGVAYEFGHDRLKPELRQVRETWKTLVHRLVAANDPATLSQHQVLDIGSDAASFSAISLAANASTVSLVHKTLDNHLAEDLLLNPELSWAAKALGHKDRTKHWFLKPGTNSVKGGDDGATNSATSSSSVYRVVSAWQSYKRGVEDFPTRHFPLVGVSLRDFTISEDSSPDSEEEKQGIFQIQRPGTFTEHKEAYLGLLEAALTRVSNDGYLVLSALGGNSVLLGIESLSLKAAAVNRRITVVKRLGLPGEFTLPVESAHLNRQMMGAVIVKVHG